MDEIKRKKSFLIISGGQEEKAPDIKTRLIMYIKVHNYNRHLLK